MDAQPFNPMYGNNTAYVTGADAAITNLVKGCSSVQALNTHATTISYVRIQGAGAATAADFPVLPGQRVIIYKPEDATVGRVFCATAGTLQLCCGNGGV